MQLSEDTKQISVVAMAVVTVICFCFGQLTSCTKNLDQKKVETRQIELQTDKMYIEKGFVKVYNPISQQYEWRKQIEDSH